MIPEEPNIFITDKCNQACIFCSTNGQNRVQTAQEIRRCLQRHRDSITIEGGEPLLSKHLLKWVAAAKRLGIKNIILSTNALLLGEPRLRPANSAGLLHCRTASHNTLAYDLVKAGVTLFNINFPSHIEKIHDLLTGTKNKFETRSSAVRHMIEVAPGRVRLTIIVNKLNFQTLPGFADFIARSFPGILYVEMNMIKVRGLVRKRTYLVPGLSRAAPFVRSAARRLKKAGISLIIDGIPLCLLDGCEETSIDCDKMLKADRLYMGEKGRVKACSSCSLKGMCAGPRKDYLKLFGSGELRASSKDPEKIISAVKLGQLKK